MSMGSMGGGHWKRRDRDDDDETLLQVHAVVFCGSASIIRDSMSENK